MAATIAAQLGETDEIPSAQIRRALKVLGAEQVQAFLQEALTIEAGEGMLVRDGSRRRTVGGVFFYLLRTKVPKSARKRIFLTAPKPAKEGTLAEPPQPGELSSPPVRPKAFTWEDRIAAIEEIGSEKGTATTVKITLIGRLGKPVDKGTCIVGVMQSSEKIPALPKGVPAPAPAKTNYVVYIGSKQWKNVAATVDDPEDTLIIEGYPQIDTKAGAISVFASNVTSKKLQQAKRANS